MKSIKSFFRALDIYGITYSFRYKDKERYQTSIGGFIVILFLILVLIMGIYYFIPFINRENYTIVYYTMNLASTEEVNIFESESNFAVGVNCEDNKKEKYNPYDLLDLKSAYVLYEKHMNGTYEKHSNSLNVHNCDYDDFYNKYNKQMDYLGLSHFKCLEKIEGTIQGIYADQIFSYFEFTVAARNNTVLNELDRFLFENDCKLQIIYMDIIIDLNNYKEPIAQYLNEIFIQLNPTLFIKRNMFYMNQYFSNDDYLIFVFGDEEPELKTLYSRYEEYSLYMGLNRITTQPANYDKYAKLYMRADLKKTIINRRYQKLMEFYADASSLLIAIYEILFFVFTFIDNFYAYHSLSKHIFFFKEIEEKTNYNNFHKRNEIKDLLSIIDFEEKKIDPNEFNEKPKESRNIPSKNKIEKQITKVMEMNSEANVKEINLYNNKNEVEDSKNIEIFKKKENPNLIKIKANNNQKRSNKKYISNKKMNDLDSEDYLQKKIASEIKNNVFNDDILNLEKLNADNEYKGYKGNNNENLSLQFPASKDNKTRDSPKINNLFNIIEIIITQFFKCCMCHDMKIKNKVNENAKEIINQKLNIISYIRNMILFDIMNQTILDNDRNDIINFLCRPIISLNDNQKHETDEFYKRYKESDFEKFSKNIKELQKKSDKSEKEQKLLFLSKEHLKKFV